MGATQTQNQGRFKPTSVVYWLRVFLAFVAGFANQFLHIDIASFGDFATFVGIGLAVVFYLISIAIIRYGFHYGEAQLKGKNKHITLGGGSFIVLWILVAVLLHTVYG